MLYQDSNSPIDNSSIANQTNNIRVTNTLNRKLGKPIEEETNALSQIDKSNKEIDKTYHKEMDKTWSLGDKISNWSMYKQVTGIKTELIQQSGKYRLAFYKKVLDTRLSALSEKCDAGLNMIRAHYRQEVASFLIAKMEELGKEITQRQFAFLDMMELKYDRLETLKKHPARYNRFNSQLFLEEERYLKFLDSLIEHFEAIAHEQITTYK